MKQATQERLHIPYFQLHGILEKSNYWDSQKSVIARVYGEERMNKQSTQYF